MVQSIPTGNPFLFLLMKGYIYRRITIEFCGDHYGHDARMRLPNIIKQLIAQKQMDGENCFDIINHLRRMLFCSFDFILLNFRTVCPLCR